MADGFEPDVAVRMRDVRIGSVGAGMIMAECHLAAYREAGFPVVAIASRREANARRVAERWGIARVHATPVALIEDPEVEIVDLAFLPHRQPELIGWPTGVASTLSYASVGETGGRWVTPAWTTRWFPQAFIGVMEQLQHAVATGCAPALTVEDNLRTLALVEAGYRSIAERRTVRLAEIEVG